MLQKKARVRMFFQRLHGHGKFERCATFHICGPIEQLPRLMRWLGHTAPAVKSLAKDRVWSLES
jgi:hypothetical protein